MIQEYYIVSGTTRKGPYNIVDIVRKIRNGSLTASTALQGNETEAPRVAQEWAELSEFFAEKKDDLVQTIEHSRSRRGLTATLRVGIHFLQRNQYSTVFSGLLVLSLILLLVAISFMLPKGFQIPAYMACFILGHFLVSVYQLTVQRMARGQPIDANYIKARIIPVIQSLLISSVIVCIPAVAGLGLLSTGISPIISLAGLIVLAVPGLFILSLYALTPMYLSDRNGEVWECMESSRKAVLHNMETAGIIYALFVINFIAGLCILLPLAITLPITMGALAELYDENPAA